MMIDKVLALNALTNKILTEDIIAALISIAVLFAVSLRKKALTLPAAAVAGIMVLCISICASYREVLFLMLSYIIIVVIDSLCKSRAEAVVHDVHKKSGARGVSQIFAHGSAAVLAIIIYYITDKQAFLYVYIICVAEACADSIASDVGVLSKRAPVSIITFKPVETGMSGGVSVLGMISSLAGCAVMSALAVISLGFSVKALIITALVPYLGMITDSLLGAGFQAKYRCAVCGKATERDEHCNTKTKHIGGIKALDNSTVNIITNIITGIIGYFAVIAFI